jgi:hypothetical protein
MIGQTLDVNKIYLYTSSNTGTNFPGTTTKANEFLIDQAGFLRFWYNNDYQYINLSTNDFVSPNQVTISNQSSLLRVYFKQSPLKYMNDNFKGSTTGKIVAIGNTLDYVDRSLLNSPFGYKITNPTTTTYSNVLTETTTRVSSDATATTSNLTWFTLTKAL